jgi:hypothetical protein
MITAFKKIKDCNLSDEKKSTLKGLCSVQNNANILLAINFSDSDLDLDQILKANSSF